MRKTILTLAMMLMLAITATAAPTITSKPSSKADVAFKGDSIVVTNGDKTVTVSGVDLQKVNKKINEALDDTLTASDGTTVEIGDQESELSPEDIKYMSDHWGEVVKDIALASILGLLLLVALVLFFRFLNRRNKYRVIEKAIVNNYPLNEFSLNDTKHSAIYVQRPVVTAPPTMPAAPQPGQVPVGTPLEGMTAENPVVLTDMVNWRALMPAIRLLAWGLFVALFGLIVVGDNGRDPFTLFGLLLIFIGIGKGFILYKEQMALQDAWKRAAQQRSAQPQEPLREGTPVPPPFDDDYKEDDNNPYQPY